MNHLKRARGCQEGQQMILFRICSFKRDYNVFNRFIFNLNYFSEQKTLKQSRVISLMLFKITRRAFMKVFLWLGKHII